MAPPRVDPLTSGSRPLRVRIYLGDWPAVHPWWPGSPPSVARLIAGQLAAEGASVTVPGTPAPEGGVDVELSLDPDGRFSEGAARLRAIAQVHAQPVGLDDSDAWHECWWPARALQLGVDRCYLSTPPGWSPAISPPAPSAGYVAIIADWRLGPGLFELLQLAFRCTSLPFLVLSPNPQPIALPTHVRWLQPPSLPEFLRLLAPAVAVLAGMHDEGTAGCLLAPGLAGMLGVPVVGSSHLPGDLLSATIEEGMSGFVVGGWEPVLPYLLHAAGLDRLRIQGRATERAAASNGGRVDAWRRRLE